MIRSAVTALTLLVLPATAALGSSQMSLSPPALLLAQAAGAGPAGAAPAAPTSPAGPRTTGPAAPGTTPGTTAAPTTPGLTPGTTAAPTTPGLTTTPAIPGTTTPTTPGRPTTPGAPGLSPSLSMPSISVNESLPSLSIGVPSDLLGESSASAPGRETLSGVSGASSNAAPLSTLSTTGGGGGGGGGTVQIGAGYVAATTDKLASKLIGVSIYDGPGQDANDLGKISDLVVNQDGQVAAVIIGVGGFLGIGEKHVAVDYKTLIWTTAADNSRRLLLQTTKQQLTDAPNFVLSGAPASP